MVRVAVPGENIIGALDHLQHGFFVSFPFRAGTRFTARQKWIDENDRLPDLNLPAGVTQPFRTMRCPADGETPVSCALAIAGVRKIKFRQICRKIPSNFMILIRYEPKLRFQAATSVFSGKLRFSAKLD